jgi:hypothetical protein
MNNSNPFLIFIESNKREREQEKWLMKESKKQRKKLSQISKNWINSYAVQFFLS